MSNRIAKQLSVVLGVVRETAEVLEARAKAGTKADGTLDLKSEEGRAKVRALVELAIRMGWAKRGVSQKWAQPPRRKGAWEWGGDR